MLRERLEPHGVVQVPDAGVAEGAVHRVGEAGPPRLGAVALAEQGVQAERADLGEGGEVGDVLQRDREHELGVGAGGDADVGGTHHGAQVCQSAPERALTPRGLRLGPCGKKPPMEARAVIRSVHRGSAGGAVFSGSRARRDVCAARGARAGRRRLPDRAPRAGRLERLPPRDHGDRAHRRRAGRPRRRRHLRGRGPRRLPGGAAAGRGVDAGRVLAAAGRPGPVPGQAAPAGVLPPVPALGLRERRPGPRPAAGEADAGRGARAPVRARPLRAQHAPGRQAVARRRPRARVQARPDAGVGRGADARHRRHRTRARPRLQVVLRGVAGGQPARRRAVPARERDVPRHRARGPGARGARARGAARAGGALQLRRAHPLLAGRGGRHGAGGRRSAVRAATASC